MKFTSHKAISSSAAILLGFDIAGIITVAIGGVLPDIIDKWISGGSEIVWNRVHRTISHWWLSWATVLFLNYTYSPEFLFGLPFQEIVFNLSFGCLLHILCDGITTGGVPFINPFKQSIGVRLFHTGSPEEYIFVTAITSAFLYVGVIQ